MFAYIKGILEEKSSNYVVVETTGIGYKIFMGETAINTIGEIGEKVKVYTHYHVREDDISLYGFKTNEELRMFELLISVRRSWSKICDNNVIRNKSIKLCTCCNIRRCFKTCKNTRSW